MKADGDVIGRQRYRNSSSVTRTIRNTTPWSRRSAKDLPYNEGHFGATSSFTAVLGRMATYSGKIVKWDEAVEKGRTLAPGLADYDWDTEPPVKFDKDGLPVGPFVGIYNPFA